MVHVVYTVVFQNVDPKKTKNKKTKKKMADLQMALQAGWGSYHARA
jgi:hypothetical protein